MIRKKVALFLLLFSAALVAEQVAIGTITGVRGEGIPVHTGDGKKCFTIEKSQFPAQGLPIYEENSDLGILKIPNQNDGAGCEWVLMYNVVYSSAVAKRRVDCTDITMRDVTSDPMRDAPAVSSGWGTECKKEGQL